MPTDKWHQRDAMRLSPAILIFRWVTACLWGGGPEGKTTDPSCDKNWHIRNNDDIIIFFKGTLNISISVLMLCINRNCNKKEWPFVVTKDASDATTIFL